VLCRQAALGEVAGKACVRFEPHSDSAGSLNIAEAYVFSDRLGELTRTVTGLR
jgi:hypothetical protein